MKSDFEKLYDYQKTLKYLNKREICYDASYSFDFNPHQYEEYMKFKEKKMKNREEPDLVSLPILSFNSPFVYYSQCFDLKNALAFYLEANHLLLSTLSLSLPEDLNQNSEVLRSLVFSEVEGSLNIENVPTTRKKVKELFDSERKPENRNEQIIRNMSLGIDFILKKPDFNKDNLRKLYTILSDECLEKEDTLKEGQYYREDEVEVDHYLGCPHSELEKTMNSLFDYVRECLDKKRNLILLPHLVHYALVYYHPYFDYNGRTARMVSFWISLLENSTFVPLFSEAINQDKNRYYLALEETRNNHNDLTYFLLYLLNTSTRYCYLYIDIENLVQKEKNQSLAPLSSTEQSYLRKILMKAKGKFSYSDFLNFAGLDITKQGALKILNRFTSLKILKSTIFSKTKFFEVNKSLFPYTFQGKKVKIGK